MLNQINILMFKKVTVYIQIFFTALFFNFKQQFNDTTNLLRNSINFIVLCEVFKNYTINMHYFCMQKHILISKHSNNVKCVFF